MISIISSKIFGDYEQHLYIPDALPDKALKRPAKYVVKVSYVKLHHVYKRTGNTQGRPQAYFFGRTEWKVSGLWSAWLAQMWEAE